MVSFATSSKKTAIAAVLVGLLAGALGTYFAHATPETPPATAGTPAASASAATSAPPTNAAATGAASAASTAASASAAPLHHTKAQAAAALMALPELQAWSALLEKNSGGATHGALIEDDPAPRVVKGKRYWQFSFVENTPEAVQRWESFLISADGDILIDDVTTDELLTLDRWRKEKRPAQRTSSGG